MELTLPDWDFFLDRLLMDMIKNPAEDSESVAEIFELYDTESDPPSSVKGIESMPDFFAALRDSFEEDCDNYDCSVEPLDFRKKCLQHQRPLPVRKSSLQNRFAPMEEPRRDSACDVLPSPEHRQPNSGTKQWRGYIPTQIREAMETGDQIVAEWTQHVTGSRISYWLMSQEGIEYDIVPQEPCKYPEDGVEDAAPTARRPFNGRQCSFFKTTNRKAKKIVHILKADFRMFKVIGEGKDDLRPELLSVPEESTAPEADTPDISFVNYRDLELSLKQRHPMFRTRTIEEKNEEDTVTMSLAAMQLVEAAKAALLSPIHDDPGFDSKAAVRLPHNVAIAEQPKVELKSNFQFDYTKEWIPVVGREAYRDVEIVKCLFRVAAELNAMDPVYRKQEPRALRRKRVLFRRH